MTELIIFLIISLASIFALLVFILSRGASGTTFDREKYRTLIRDLDITSIAEISQRVQKPMPVVQKEIQQMIDEKYILDIHIDKQSGKLIFSDASNTASYMKQEDETEFETVCKNCGAKNSSSSNRCEYCGTPLHR